MNQRHKHNSEGSSAAQLRQAFDSTFALPRSLTSPEVEDLLTIRVAGDPYAIRLFDIAEMVSALSTLSTSELE